MLDESLNGSQGKNRSHGGVGLLSAQTDVEAASAFLAEFQSPGTRRIYHREIERLALWALHIKRKPLSSLAREDFDEYTRFLANPQPSKVWCGPKKPRTSLAWRPFVGPLQNAAVVTALAALNSFFKWLTDAGYLAGNPLGLTRKKTSVPHAMAKVQKVSRYLEPEIWRATEDALEALPRDSEKNEAHYRRMRFWLDFLFFLAPRAGELESHTLASISEYRGQWWWQVVGKGQKTAKVPLPDAMVDSVMAWRAYLGLSPLPQLSADVPILLDLASIERFRNNDPSAFANVKGITARQLNRLLKDLFLKAVDRLPAELRYKADLLKKASAHWGRHTSITAMVDSGLDPRYVRKNARHSDPRTTLLYVHEQEDAWHEAAQALKKPGPAKD